MKRAGALIIVGVFVGAVLAFAGGDKNMTRHLSEPGQGETGVGQDNQGDADQARSGVTW